MKRKLRERPFVYIAIILMALIVMEIYGIERIPDNSEELIKARALYEEALAENWRLKGELYGNEYLNELNEK